MKECPSCGNMVSDDQTVCPMCGTKLGRTQTAPKRAANQELESALFSVNSRAEVALYTNRRNEFSGLETSYLGVIRRFPTESKAYTAYVHYMIEAYLKLERIKAAYTTDIGLIVTRCKNYLQKAKEYADEEELETILQLDSALTAQIEEIEHDPTVQAQMEKNKKNLKSGRKWFIIGGVVICAILIFIWIFS